MPVPSIHLHKGRKCSISPARRSIIHRKDRTTNHAVLRRQSKGSCGVRAAVTMYKNELPILLSLWNNVEYLATYASCVRDSAGKTSPSGDGHVIRLSHRCLFHHQDRTLPVRSKYFSRTYPGAETYPALKIPPVCCFILFFSLPKFTIPSEIPLSRSARTN
jgi:hypothetical protein